MTFRLAKSSFENGEALMADVVEFEKHGPIAAIALNTRPSTRSVSASGKA
jgi:hypothetical protein